MRVLAMILAGGKGKRLYPLTRHRTKPAVPFGGNYRIVDFVLSNMVNSGLNSIYVLVQYRSQSLIEHLRTGWRGRGITTDQFITVVPPQMRHGELWYRGSADAIGQNLNLIQSFRPDVVAVFAGDLVFRMDVVQMVAFHRSAGAEVTIACSPVPVDEARGRFGVLRLGPENRVAAIAEKPDEPDPLPGRSDHTMASMGCFLFKPASLVAHLAETVGKADRPLDISRDVLPTIVSEGGAFAYNFEDNEIPGMKPYEKRGYWCDVGTLDMYWSAHMDLLGEQPLFDLRNPEWPIYPARVNMPPTSFHNAQVDESLIGEGGWIERATVRRSVIGRGVTIARDSVVEDAVVMEHTKIGPGSVVRRAIVDRYNEVPPGVQLTPEAEDFDGRVCFDRVKRLVVLPRGGIAAPPENGDFPEGEVEGIGSF